MQHAFPCKSTWIKATKKFHHMARTHHRTCAETPSNKHHHGPGPSPWKTPKPSQHKEKEPSPTQSTSETFQIHQFLMQKPTKLHTSSSIATNLSPLNKTSLVIFQCLQAAEMNAFLWVTTAMLTASSDPVKNRKGPTLAAAWQHSNNHFAKTETAPDVWIMDNGISSDLTMTFKTNKTAF